MPITDWGGVELLAEAALSADVGSYGQWDESRWDSATWGPDIVWEDISSYLRSLDTDRSFSRDVQAWNAGKAALVLDNKDGRFSPDNLDGPYVTAGISQIRPLLPVRIRATYNGVMYPLYRGYASSWQESWTGGAPGEGDAVAQLACEDEFAMIAAFDGYEQAPVGAGERTGARMHRILNNAGHIGERNIAVGRNTVQATTLAANALTELKLVADSEGGATWPEADGTVMFEDQYALMENARSNTLQAIYGDDGGDELPYTADVAPYAGDLVKNIAAFARVGGTQQVAADPTSRALYRDRREPRTDLVCETDAQVLQLATFHVERFKEPEKRFNQLTFAPMRDPAVLWPQALGRRVRDLVRVIRRPPGEYTMVRDCHISAIRHHIVPGDWRTTFGLWSATPYLRYASSRWDVARWDIATWFF